MISLISVSYLVLVTTLSWCRPQENREPEVKIISTTPTYDYDYGRVSTTHPYEYDFVGDGVTESEDYADYGYGDYGEEYDNYGHYGDYYAYGDRNNPADTELALAENKGHITPPCQMPWVYIIVPVLHIDMFYLSDDTLDDMDVKLPMDTYFFEFGEFGMGHLDMGSHFFDYGAEDDSSEEEVTTPLSYPQYDVMAEHYDTAGDLDDANVMEYPGIDHDSYWVDWIFMRPPDQIIR